MSGASLGARTVQLTTRSPVNPYKVVYYVVQYFLIVVAPVFFSAAFVSSSFESRSSFR